MLFYAATMPAKAFDRIQHSTAVVAHHDHTGLSSFSVHEDHADHHEDQPDSDGPQDDRLAGGHHHHGDTGPNLIVADAGADLPIAPLDGVHGIRHERKIAGLRSVGPERPPRDGSLNA